MSMFMLNVRVEFRSIRIKTYSYIYMLVKPLIVLGI